MKCLPLSFVCGIFVSFISISIGQDKASPAIDPRFVLPATDDGIPGAGPLRRKESFQKSWATRRAIFAASNATEQNRLVLLGDSITQGWGDKFTKHFPGLAFANRGIGGDTTRGMLLRLKEDVLSLKPTGVVMLMGTNDLEENADANVIAGNVKLMIDAIDAAKANTPIVLCLVFPSSTEKNRPADKIKAINEAYTSLAKGYPQITVIDTWTLFAGANGDAKPEYFRDMLHLNEEGYAKWAAALRPVLATLRFIEQEPDTFQPEPGFVSLFNGKDLTGWGYQKTSAEALAKMKAPKKKAVANAPVFPIVEQNITFDNKTISSDGRYEAIHGRLVVKTPVEGRRIQQLWTTEEFGSDFVLKLEFRATPNADSGVFIRQPQLQCRDFPLAGPYTNLKNYKPQDWNELVVEVKGNVAHCTCNGEVLEAEFKVPATGPIGLEGDRGQMEYRRLRIKKL